MLVRCLCHSTVQVQHLRRLQLLHDRHDRHVHLATRHRGGNDRDNKLHFDDDVAEQIEEGINNLVDKEKQRHRGRDDKGWALEESMEELSKKLNMFGKF